MDSLQRVSRQDMFQYGIKTGGEPIVPKSFLYPVIPEHKETEGALWMRPMQGRSCFFFGRAIGNIDAFFLEIPKE